MLAPRVDNRPYLAPLLAALIALAWLALLVWGESPYSSFLDHGQFAEIELGLNGTRRGSWRSSLPADGDDDRDDAPTSLPLVTLFRRLVRGAGLRTAGRAPDRRYLATWSFFGLVAHLSDAGLHASVNRWHCLTITRS